MSFRRAGEAVAKQRTDRPKTERVDTIPATYRTITSPSTQGINTNPMKNVTDPHSISARESPSISDANPAGVICGAGDLPAPAADGDGGGTGTGGGGGGSSEKGAGAGGERRRLKVRAESSRRTLDSWSGRCLLIMPAFRRNRMEQERCAR